VPCVAVWDKQGEPSLHRGMTQSPVERQRGTRTTGTRNSRRGATGPHKDVEDKQKEKDQYLCSSGKTAEHMAKSPLYVATLFQSLVPPMYDGSAVLGFNEKSLFHMRREHRAQAGTLHLERNSSDGQHPTAV
jgi:hypothetical protein